MSPHRKSDVQEALEGMSFVSMDHFFSEKESEEQVTPLVHRTHLTIISVLTAVRSQATGLGKTEAFSSLSCIVGPLASATVFFWLVLACWCDSTTVQSPLTETKWTFATVTIKIRVLW